MIFQLQALSSHSCEWITMTVFAGFFSSFYRIGLEYETSLRKYNARIIKFLWPHYSSFFLTAARISSQQSGTENGTSFRSISEWFSELPWIRMFQMLWNRTLLAINSMLAQWYSPVFRSVISTLFFSQTNETNGRKKKSFKKSKIPKPFPFYSTKKLHSGRNALTVLPFLSLEMLRNI